MPLGVCRGQECGHSLRWWGLVNYSDADGNPATSFQFWDGGTAANSGYFWTPSNSHNPADTEITVSAADVANHDVWLRGGQAAGLETMYVRSFDGSDRSAWDLFQLHTLV